MFGPIFFAKGGEFLDLHYKIQPASHHVAKFHGDHPRELRDTAFKKTSWVKQKPSRTIVREA